MSYSASAPATLETDVKTVWVPTIANIKAPTLTELTATGVVEIGQWIVADGWKPTRAQSFIDDAREGYGTVGKIAGPKTWDNTSVQITDNVNADEGTPNVAAKTLIPGASGYFVRRRSVLKAASDPFAAGELVSVIKATITDKEPVAHAGNTRMQSVIYFNIDPQSTNEESTVAAGA